MQQIELKKKINEIKVCERTNDVKNTLRYTIVYRGMRLSRVGKSKFFMRQDKCAGRYVCISNECKLLNEGKNESSPNSAKGKPFGTYMILRPCAIDVSDRARPRNRNNLYRLNRKSRKTAAFAWQARTYKQTVYISVQKCMLMSLTTSEVIDRKIDFQRNPRRLVLGQALNYSSGNAGLECKLLDERKKR